MTTDQQLTGSVRHSLIELTVVGVLAEIVFALVGGAPAAAPGRSC